jgi:phosphohistidine swiveling domain-containing protein
MEYVKVLNELEKADLSLAGGKGASLGELVRAGLPVPEGFVVTTKAYDAFLKTNGLDGIIREALKGNPPNGKRIREAFLRAEIPREVADEIVSTYREMGLGSVAVRSSATAEDLPGAAFAGQHETFLNVNGEEELLKAVKGCWASLWSDRAIEYREKMGIPHEAVKMAVVVQRMVNAEVSGVMFTANPVTGRRDEVVINASPGLGEAIVSGTVTPDHYVLRKTRFGWKVVEKRPGMRGTSKRGREFVLSEKDLKRLASLGLKIQEHFGRPQDIEWAIEGGKIFILQARPITTLPEPLPEMGRLAKTLIRTLAEIVPERPLPMDLEWIQALFSNAVGRVARYFGLGVPAIDEIFIVEDGIPVKVNPGFSVRPRPGILLAPFKAIRLALKYKPSAWESDSLLGEYLSRVEKIRATADEVSSRAEIKSAIEGLLDNLSLIGELRKRYLPGILLSYLKVRLMLKLARRDSYSHQLLFTCVETKVIETNRELEGLADFVRKAPELRELFENHEPGEILKLLPGIPAGAEFLERFRGFLEKYGHREAAGSAMLSHGTWSERPEVVVGIIKGLLSAGSMGKRSCMFEEVLEEVLSSSFLGKRPFRGSFVRSLENARVLHKLREDTRFYAMASIPVMKRLLRRAGELLVGEGALEEPADVFYLTVDELDEEPEVIAEKVKRRKKRWEELRDVPFIDPRLLLETREGAEDTLLVGIPGSPGIAEGTVKVIRGPHEFHKLRKGDVLVAPYTTPAWTPLFKLASAVVVDTGGPLSHAAIVAREYGIPAVMGTGNATKILKDGMRVRVDGTRGLVFPAEV